MPIPILVFQRRLANIAIGFTALRGQGKGATEITINYLKDLPLKEFSNVKSQEKFLQLLDKFTIELSNILPNKSWGAARKALNIFLLQASYHKYVSKEYNLDKIVEYLELPLDNPNAYRLISLAEKKGIKLRWDSIKRLTPEQNKGFQDFTLKLAREKYNCPRAYLDIYFWRSND